MIGTLSSKSNDTENNLKQLYTKYEEKSRTVKELEQEKIIQSALSTIEKNMYKKRNMYVLVALVATSVVLGLIVTNYNADKVTNPVLLSNYNSNYVIENLRGDVIKTWVSWNIPSDRIMHVGIVNTAKLSKDKIDAVKDAITSTESVSIDDSILHIGLPGTSSTYYKGWQGAVTFAATNKTHLYIPQKFDVSTTPSESGDIVIVLTDDSSPDGLSGFTKSLADGNEILRSKITIYDANSLTSSQIGSITRHEFGHALGLAHSSAPEDLMHAVIQTPYPYISGCDIDALVGLYDGDKQSLIVCKK